MFDRAALFDRLCVIEFSIRFAMPRQPIRGSLDGSMVARSLGRGEKEGGRKRKKKETVGEGRRGKGKEGEGTRRKKKERKGRERRGKDEEKRRKKE